MRVWLIAFVTLAAACAERSPFQGPGDVVSGSWPLVRTLAVDGSYLYAGTGYGKAEGETRFARIERMPKDGGDIDVLFESDVPDVDVTDLVVDTGQIYFITRPSRGIAGLVSGSVSSISIDGGEATVLAADVEGACSVAVVDHRFVYWSGSWSAGANAIFHRRDQQTGAVVARSLDAKAGCRFLVDDSRVYFQATLAISPRLYAFPIIDDGAPALELGGSPEGQMSGEGLATDPGLAFYGEGIVWASQSGNVFLTPKNQGEQLEISHNGRYHRVLAAGDDLFVMRLGYSGASQDDALKRVHLDPVRLRATDYNARRPMAFTSDDDHVYVADEEQDWLVRVPR